VDPSTPSAHALVREGGRVLIFRALPGLGDFLCVTPALRALRTNRPDIEVTYVGLPASAGLVTRYPHYVDRFVPFPGFPGLPDQRPNVHALPGFLSEIQAQRFDLAVQLHGSGAITNAVVELLGAVRSAGHHPRGSTPPDAATYLPWIESSSEIRRSLRLMAHLGWSHDDERLEFPIDPATTAPVIERDYVVIHPGGSDPSRRWSAEGFREVGAELSKSGFRVVLTGTVGEAERNRRIAASLAEPPIDLTGRTTLDELAVTLRGSRLLVANDTGVAHLAVALGVPSVVVFTGSDRERWRPLDQQRHAGVPGSPRRVLAEARRMLIEPPVPHAA
jgi:ADP-heptose:LPS heptosyltransferase